MSSAVEGAIFREMQKQSVLLKKILEHLQAQEEREPPQA